MKLPDSRCIGALYACRKIAQPYGRSASSQGNRLTRWIIVLDRVPSERQRFFGRRSGTVVDLIGFVELTTIHRFAGSHGHSAGSHIAQASGRHGTASTDARSCRLKSRELRLKAGELGAERLYLRKQTRIRWIGVWLTAAGCVALPCAVLICLAKAPNASETFA